MIATGRTRAEVEHKTFFVKQRLGFYASTRRTTRRAAPRFLDIGQRLFRVVAMQGKWREMVDVSDDMLDTFATVATCDELGAKLKRRAGRPGDGVHLDLPPEVRQDAASVRYDPRTPCDKWARHPLP